MVESPEILDTKDSVKFRRKRYTVGLAFASVVIAILFAAAIYYQKATSLGDPLFSNVEESDIVTGRVFLVRRTKRKNKPAEVELSPRLTCEILLSLTPNQYDWRPMKWQMLGTLEYKVKSGKEYCVELYQTHEKEAAFKVNDTYYRGGSEAKLMGLMRKADE